MDENAKGSCTRPHKTPPDFATQTLIREVGQAIEIDLIWPTEGLLRGSLGGGQPAPEDVKPILSRPLAVCLSTVQPADFCKFLQLHAFRIFSWALKIHPACTCMTHHSHANCHVFGYSDDGASRAWLWSSMCGRRYAGRKQQRVRDHCPDRDVVEKLGSDPD